MKSIEEIIKKIEEDKKERRLNETKNLTDAFEIQKKQKEEHLRRMKIYENSLHINNNQSSNNLGGTLSIDIPEDFYIATLVNSSELLYYTDSFRRINLEFYLDSNINIRNTNEIVRNGNDFYLTGNFGPSDTYFVKLTNCRLKNGIIFQFDKIEHRFISSYINYVHGMCFYKGYIYLTSRSATTTVARINVSNIDDINTLTLPSTYINMQNTDIIAYKDYIYIMPSLTTTRASILKMDLTLATYSVLVTTGTSSSPSRRVRTTSCFLLYNDEIFIPIINNTTGGVGVSQFGMEVWGLDGVRKRQVYNQPINAGNPSLTPMVHWMGIYNDKLIISNAVMGTTTSHRSLVRMDVSTLAIEDSIPMDTLITDDNSILSDGYVYLNGEAPTNTYLPGSWDIDTSKTPNPIAKLIKIKYDDFTDRVDLIPDFGYGSYGSLNPTSYII